MRIGLRSRFHAQAQVRIPTLCAESGTEVSFHARPAKWVERKGARRKRLGPRGYKRKKLQVFGDMPIVKILEEIDSDKGACEISENPYP